MPETQFQSIQVPFGERRKSDFFLFCLSMQLTIRQYSASEILIIQNKKLLLKGKNKNNLNLILDTFNTRCR